MTDSAIIDFDGNIKYKEEILFKFKKLDETVFIKKYITEKTEFLIINVPLSLKNLFNENRTNSQLTRFIRFLKEKEIKKIILTERAKKIKNIEKIMEENFNVFKGKSVINFHFSNIIKKYINKTDIKKPELVFLTDNFENFYYFFKKVFSLFRTDAVITNNKEKFYNFSQDIYRDYGIFLNVTDKENFKIKENHILINIDYEGFDLVSDLDIKNINLIFSRSKKFLFLYDYFKFFNESLIEYIIYNIFGSLKKANLTVFFTESDIRIVKIYKK